MVLPLSRLSHVRWVLLLRAVNLGATNKIAMKDLTRVLEDLGYSDVTTYLNSGNATFTCSRRSARALADDVEKALSSTLRLNVRACVRKASDIAAMLDNVPDLPGYLAINVLFERPDPRALKDFLVTDWSPEVVKGDDQAIYIGFMNAAKTKLTLAKIEKALGVSATARTPATLRRMVSDRQNKSRTGTSSASARSKR